MNYSQKNIFNGDILGRIYDTVFVRAVVTKESVCPSVITPIDTILVSQRSQSGNLTSDQTICQGTLPSDMSITNNLGGINWEKSLDGLNWESILNATGNVLSGSSIGKTYSSTYLRGVVKNGACLSVYTNSIFISVDSLSQPGILNGEQSICFGSSPSQINISNFNGSLIWQKSIDSINYNDVSNSNNSSLIPGELDVTTYYRVKATNGTCPSKFSNPIKILVSPKSLVGTLSSNQLICSGLTPATINLNNAVGTISWQYSNDNLVWNPILNQSSLSLNNSVMGNLTSKRYYKAIVKSGNCTAVTSNIITVTVNPKPIVSGGSDKAICQNTNITLLGSGASSYLWDNGVQNGISFIPTKNTLYTVIGTDLNGCKDTATVNVTLLPQPTIQIINSNPSIICQNSYFGLTTNSTDVSTYQWKLNGVNIPNANGSSISYNKSGNYSVLGTSKAGCSQMSSNLPISFTPLPLINAGIDRSICSGQSTQLLASQATNYTWNSNIQNGDSVYPINTTKYIVSTTDNNGCSNSDTVLVTVNYKTFSEISLSSVGSYELNGKIYDQSGKYTQTLKNKNGCDSIITLNLIIEHLGLTYPEFTEIKIYPNPTSDGKIYIETTDEIKQISILNTDGKTLLISKDKEVDLGLFGRGVYFLEVNTLKGMGVVKVVY